MIWNFFNQAFYIFENFFSFFVIPFKNTINPIVKFVRHLQAKLWGAKTAEAIHLKSIRQKEKLLYLTRYFEDSFPDIFRSGNVLVLEHSPDITAQKIMKFSIKDFFSKCDKIRSFLRIWSHLLKKSLIENFIFCTVYRAV